MTDDIKAEDATATQVGEQSQTWYFTYGANHLDSNGGSLGGCYTPITITGDDLRDDCGFLASRELMMQHRGNKYCTNYPDAESAGVQKWNYVERSLESVSIKAFLKQDRIDGILSQQRESVRRRAALIEQAAAVLAKLPMNILDKVFINCDCVDLDNLTHEEVTEAMRELSAGRWERKLNGSDDSKLDYIGTVDGVKVRMRCASAPGSCRVVEYEETIPAQTIKRRKLICNEPAQ